MLAPCAHPRSRLSARHALMARDDTTGAERLTRLWGMGATNVMQPQVLHSLLSSETWNEVALGLPT